MRYFLCLLLLACAAFVHARDDNGYNTYYIESEKDKPWEEIPLPLPPYPDQNASWLPIYISNTFSGKTLLMTNSIRTPADDTVHYVLNVQSNQGIDNITAEAVRCGERAAKTLAYGDDVNHRWIVPKRGHWQTVSTVLRDIDPVRAALYTIFCVDGIPKNSEEWQERLQKRASR
ncbi:CNP1-like family protein [Stenoxybacter acetivorans]|uniref:CNP1-like family protein n=1 Tax=Stenoxybacter acetivorans TaxID=422441 RepID=UPI000689638C|nr:CNP1-like family protein [Stenoxybacter acetivorans]